MKFSFNSINFAPDPQVRLEEPAESETPQSLDQGEAATSAKEISPEVLIIM